MKLQNYEAVAEIDSKISTESRAVIKLRTGDFNLNATLESGQVFGFTKTNSGRYEGAISGTSVKLWQEDNFLLAESAGRKISEEKLIHYFDLDHDLTQIYRILSEDARLKPVLLHFKGLRVIRQDPWEALACFIISSNNNIKRIQKIRNNLSRAFSSPELGFPNAHVLARTNEFELRELGLGYRAPFLLQVARIYAAWRELPGEIRKADYQMAKAQLLRFPGIGEKVADCVLLFGFQKYEAFPVDVWIHRTVRKLYFRNRKTSERKIREFGQRRWGNYAGYVQQYLYHGAKSGIL